MATSPTIDAYQGSAFTRPFVLLDAAGRALVGEYSGSEPVSAEVWSGDERATLFSPPAAWSDAANAVVRVAFTADHTATLAPGLYPILLAVDGEKKRVGYLNVLAVAGEDAAPLVYGTYDGVLRRAGDWLPRMQGVSSQSRFAEELHEAFDWTNRQVLSRARAYLERRAGGYLGDPEAADLLNAVDAAEGDGDAALMEARLAIIGDVLDDAGTALVLTPGIIAANEHYAASVILNRIMPAKDSADWPALAAYHRGRANSLLSAEAFAVDVDGDGAGDFSLGPV